MTSDGKFNCTVSVRNRMLAESFRFKGHRCFRDNWSGFDEFKPINVIIGRNNTGKSQLLDVVELLTTHDIRQLEFPYYCTGFLDEHSLRECFSERYSGGDLPGHNHWNAHGKELVGQAVEWRYGADTGIEIEMPVDFRDTSGKVKAARLKRINKILESARTPISGRNFRRLVADRDVQTECETDKLTLSSNGSGATNIIRKFIISAEPQYPEDIVQVEMRHALDKIFGEDGEFERIEIRQLGDFVEGEDTKRWEVYLGEREKGLVPLSSSGSGLKTVILVLLNLLIIPHLESKDEFNYIFAFEELENNLHPALLRRLLGYLAKFVTERDCFLFLTTHSNVTLDFFGTRTDSQIIHVAHDGRSAMSKTISAHFERTGLLNELGSKPSDLLQANGVLWLEGPSDRFYLNRFIELYSKGELQEGRDYQCAYYGGANLANSTFSAPEESDFAFTNLLRLNHNIAVICDGDRTADNGKGSRIKKRVQRIKQEVEQIPGSYLWITDAKEIENYIPGEVWSAVYKVDGVPNPERYDTFSTNNFSPDNFVNKNLKRKTFDKCDFAVKAVPHLTRNALEKMFELDKQMKELVERIEEWNS